MALGSCPPVIPFLPAVGQAIEELVLTVECAQPASLENLVLHLLLRHISEAARHLLGLASWPAKSVHLRAITAFHWRKIPSFFHTSVSHRSPIWENRPIAVSRSPARLAK